MINITFESIISFNLLFASIKIFESYKPLLQLIIDYLYLLIFRVILKYQLKCLSKQQNKLDYFDFLMQITSNYYFPITENIKY